MKKIKGIVIENVAKKIGFNIDHVIMYERNENEMTIMLSSDKKITIENKEDKTMNDEIEKIILKYWGNK